MIVHLICENLLQKSHTRDQHVQCVSAVNPSLCACDVRDSQITLAGYQAIVHHHQPQLCLSFYGECGDH